MKKTILITGTSSGIGKSTVIEFARKGWNVIATQRNPEKETDFSSFDNVEVLITNDNSTIIEKCSNSKLIISQHSGSVYLGEYTNTPVLIIYKGSTSIGDINTTIYFNKSLGTKSHFNYAFSYLEIENFLKDFNN